MEAGLDKAAVRALAKHLNIPVWDKPAQPCLSSRVPYGTPVTIETLSKIERAEDFLRGLGLREFRARHHDKLCRVEASEADMEIAFSRRDEIVSGLRKIGYLWISLDLAGSPVGQLERSAEEVGNRKLIPSVVCPCLRKRIAQQLSVPECLARECLAQDCSDRFSSLIIGTQ